MEQQDIRDRAFWANSKEEQADLLGQLGDWRFYNYTEAPLFRLPGQAVVDPDVIAEYIWPGNVAAGFSRFEYIKAAS